ncbi:hypothetical protein MTR67_048831 [Solanum verrucosum]|uniref:Uncharacterized protein n=1 Tax=Solanum verrucosum TaxID=315347 RepID=A0AAF0V250_SOLVR|nr:hypothetical protein MTR67_048831 [Solanum verrucosum]
MIMVTCLYIRRRCRPNGISTLNVRVYKGKTKHNIILKGI